MALETRSTTVPADEAYKAILNNFRAIQRDADGMHADTLGSVSWLQLIGYSNNVATFINTIDAIIATTDNAKLIAHAQSLSVHSTDYDVASEYTAMKANALSVRDFIKSNIPNAPGDHSTDDWGHYQLSQYHSSDTQVFRDTVLTDLKDSFI